MQNKSSKGWADVQLIIGSISIALTLGFWGLFASREKAVSGVSASVALPSQPDPVVAAPPALLPGQKLLFAGTAGTTPQVPPVVTNAKRRRGGGGGGGAVTTTSSSRP
jgi:hypothetical protein